jgi:large subunit ribosomal protein L30
MAEGKTIRIRQVKSGICCPEKHKRVLRGLGFKRLNQVVERPDTPGIRGMVQKVRHLVEVIGERP